MCVEFKLGKVPEGLEERRLKKQEFLSLLMQIPVNYYNIKTPSIPKGLLKRHNLAEYKKLILLIVNSPSLTAFIHTAEVGFFTEEINSFKISSWITRIKHDSNMDRDYCKEALIKITEAETWFLAVRSILEAEFMYSMLDGDDRGAKEVLVRRFGQNWSERLHIAQFNAESARKLAEDMKKSSMSDGNINVTFSLAGT